MIQQQQHSRFVSKETNYVNKTQRIRNFFLQSSIEKQKNEREKKKVTENNKRALQICWFTEKSERERERDSM